MPVTRGASKKKVNKKSTNQAVRANAIMIADQVSDMIESRKLKQGEHIREQELADLFGTSRGPVREALKILESRFQVEIIPNIGAKVPQLTAEELVEIHDLRGAIFGVAARWAAIRASDKELKALSDEAKKLKKFVDSDDDLDRFVNATSNWRHLLIEAAHSKRLERNYAANGFGAVSFIWNTSWSTKAERDRVAQDWIDCAAALEKRDGNKAEVIVAKLYRRFSKELERFAQGISMSRHF